MNMCIFHVCTTNWHRVRKITYVSEHHGNCSNKLYIMLFFTVLCNINITRVIAVVIKLNIMDLNVLVHKYAHKFS